MATGNSGALDGVRRITAKIRDLTVDGGLPGAPLGFRMRGATKSGAPAAGTWRAGDVVPDRAGNWWFCTAGGTMGTPHPAVWKSAGGAGQHPFTVMIAASDAPAAEKAASDYVCTGTADQTVINTAIASLAGPGTVRFSTGTFSITAPITCSNSYCIIQGAGFATYIQAAASFSGTALINVGPAAVLDGMLIQDIQLDGNYGVASGTTVGILLSAGESIISRLEVKNTTGDGIYLQAYDGSTVIYEILVEDTHIWSPAGYGLHVGPTVDNSEFHRVFAVSGSSDGIYVEGSDCKFFQCHPYFNAGNGMTIVDGTENNTVVDGEYETNTGYGIQVQGSDHTTITGGASFYENGSGSVDFTTSDISLQGQVAACKFHDLGTVATTVISADANTYGLAIMGNTFDAAAAPALTSVVSLASQGVSVTGNIFRTNNGTVNSVYLNGASYCKIIGNFLDEQVTEANGADYNTVAHNGWNNVAATPFTFTGANSVATDNLPVADRPAAPTLVTVAGNGGTITAPAGGYLALTTSSARTGLILTAGSYNGQQISLVNQGTASLAWNATPATSHVAAAAGSIAATTAAVYVWDGNSSLWYRAGTGV